MESEEIPLSVTMQQTGMQRSCQAEGLCLQGVKNIESTLDPRQGNIAMASILS